MYRDRSQKEQEEYRFRENPQNLNFRHDQRLNTQMGPEMRQVQNFLSGFDEQKMGGLDPLSAFEDGDFDEFEEIYNGFAGPRPTEMPPQTPLSSQVPPDLLQGYIKSFIDSARGQQHFGSMGVPDLALPAQEAAKIKGRSSVLARHMFPQQSGDFVESQISSFMEPFVRGMQRQRFAPMGREGQLSEGQMDEIFRESQQTEQMFQDFQNFQTQQNFEQYYQQANETERWVEEFEGRRPVQRVGESLQDLTRSITEINDPKLQQTQFMRLMQKMSKGEVDFVDNQLIDRSKEEFDPDQLAEEFATTSLSESERWAQEFHTGEFQPDELVREFEKEREKDVWNWLSQYEHLDSQTEEWLKDYSEGLDSSTHPYQFTPARDNPYMAIENPFQKGIELFEEGRVDQAALAFEAELQRDENNSTCWQYLGQAHAENDKDGKAIACLQRAVNTNANNSEALLSLAVSFTNDLYRDQALDTLRSWIESHPDYKDLAGRFDNPPEELETPHEHFTRNHSEVTDLFIKAARLRPNDPDADVQTALGLLFNLSNEYDKAVDCFKAALQARPKDYLLWNKLGATLANSSRSEEALGCYFRALEIKPSYVRARSNLGISFMSLRDYEKAAQYFLGALYMHPEATHIWTNLQMVFMSMQRDDLTELSAQRDVEAFRRHFEF